MDEKTFFQKAKDAFIELYWRMKLKSPEFFQGIQWIGMAAALITGIPLGLQQLEHIIGFKIELPSVVNDWQVRVVFWCGIIAKFIAKMPIDPKVHNQLSSAEKEKKLPFTQQSSVPAGKSRSVKTKASAPRRSRSPKKKTSRKKSVTKNSK